MEHTFTLYYRSNIGLQIRLCYQLLVAWRQSWFILQPDLGWEYNTTMKITMSLGVRQVGPSYRWLAGVWYRIPSCNSASSIHALWSIILYGPTGLSYFAALATNFIRSIVCGDYLQIQLRVTTHTLNIFDCVCTYITIICHSHSDLSHGFLALFFPFWKLIKVLYILLDGYYKVVTVKIACV